MKTKKNRYEAVFIYNKDKNIFKSSLEKTKSIFSEHDVSITGEEDMGLKKLAYEIKKNKEGHYYLFHLKITGSIISAIEKDIHLDEAILKHLFVKIDFKKPRKFK